MQLINGNMEMDIFESSLQALDKHSEITMANCLAY